MVIKRLVLAVALIFCIALFSCSVVLAQDITEPEPAQEEGAVSNAVVSEEVPQVEPEMSQGEATEWVWGEVVSVDAANKQAVIKHLDYESYEEVEITVKVDDQTKFENAADLSEIKAGDHVTIDYKIVDGANIAEFMVVEKEQTGEEAPAESAVEVEAPAQQETPVQAEVVSPESEAPATTETPATTE